MVASCRAVGLVIGAALAIHAAPAHAQVSPWTEGVSEENKTQAKDLLAHGNQLLLEKKYVEALEVYQKAITFWDHPAIRFNMVRCFIQLGRTLEAHESIEKALKYGAAPHEETVYNEAVAYQKLLANQVGDLTVSCNQPDIALTLDGKPLAGACPGTQTTRVLTGEHQIVGTKQGLLTKTVQVVVAAGAPRTIDVKLDPLAKAARIEHRWPQWVPWSVFGGGLAVAGVGILFQVLGQSQMEDYDRWVDTTCTNNCPPGDPRREQFAHLEDAAELKSTIGVSLMITGGAAVATGAVMLFLNRGRTVYPAAVEVAPSPGGATVSWRGRF